MEKALGRPHGQRAIGRQGEQAAAPAQAAYSPTGDPLLGRGAGRMGPDLPGGVLRRLRRRPARYVQALRRQAPALDLLSGPLGRAGGGARQPVRAARRPGQAAQVRPGRLRRHRGPLVLLPLRLQPLGHRPQPDLQLDAPRRPSARRPCSRLGRVPPAPPTRRGRTPCTPCATTAGRGPTSSTCRPPTTG